ncbi:hypothetical protein L6452_00605 [Arctium lappa]|uniref:Uncharacterized protein n=1 Tax=Arctium lappa TaxID=4217 RepID=A0ACB9FDY5_ARCLA|nr:hypothetical protein L6452_00605 [Arctium lappa]
MSSTLCFTVLTAQSTTPLYNGPSISLSSSTPNLHRPPPPLPTVVAPSPYASPVENANALNPLSTSEPSITSTRKNHTHHRPHHSPSLHRRRRCQKITTKSTPHPINALAISPSTLPLSNHRMKNNLTTFHYKNNNIINGNLAIRAIRIATTMTKAPTRFS